MSLIAHYKLNDLCTLLVDSTGNGNNLTQIGGSVDVYDDSSYGTDANFVSGRNSRLQMNAPAGMVGIPLTQFRFGSIFRVTLFY